MKPQKDLEMEQLSSRIMMHNRECISERTHLRKEKRLIFQHSSCGWLSSRKQSPEGF
jgi:hypothetical protein